ncbi:cell division protein FtsQ/DivIB [Bradyrhizobium erythrophlei]|jgi:cell division protein FtsQ|uniref:Cell division protein FtsQ n=1 Tax=Bradyrhizobium erythrophlei TaxID=1437360 RepID=A0A1M7UAT7_9BRAD|nr:cell division protein FtsQ/DivIB [Bradyrhizobium erythrophlei]SHN80056.1 cell division protein FtsQ [Bradyrhizobium erythrophlei]
MNGGGRLARSPRSPRQQTDLMDALAGVAAALRAWLPFAASPAKVRRRNDQPSGLIAFMENRLPRRSGLAATLLLLIASTGLGVVKGGHLEAFLATLSEARNAIANSAGFRITSVAINGRKQLTQDEILTIGGVNGRSSLLFLDASSVREKLKADPWISEATVLKLYPGQLRIDIVERAPFALWQRNGQLSVISEDGAVLERYVSPRFVKLPLVVGKGAETRARDFLALLARYPQINDVTKAAVLVGERRWNLRLNDGLDIRLPENDVSNALATLSNLDKNEHLFAKDIVAIDLRQPDRLVVQLSDDAAKAREEALKKKDPKKKVGDA